MREHMIKETDSGIDLRYSRAIEINAYVDIRFGGLALYTGCSLIHGLIHPFGLMRLLCVLLDAQAPQESQW